MYGRRFIFVFFPPGFKYREEYEYRILLDILNVTLDTAFENLSQLLPPQKKQKVCGTRIHHIPEEKSCGLGIRGESSCEKTKNTSFFFSTILG